MRVFAVREGSTALSELELPTGALDREVRRLARQLETERRDAAGAQPGRKTEPAHADGG